MSAVAVAATGAWAYVDGPFDGEWRLERQVATDLDAWENSPRAVSELPAAADGRASEATAVVADTDPTELTVLFYAGSCATYTATAVESAHAVGVLVLVRRTRGDCTSEATLSTVALELAEPIHGRVLFDAQTGDELSIQGELPDGLDAASG